jgi:acyl carrier protein
VEEFYRGLAEILEIDPTLVTQSLVLREYNWDSLAIISSIALIDECFSVTVKGAALSGCQTVGDIIGLVAKQKASG